MTEQNQKRLTWSSLIVAVATAAGGVTLDQVRTADYSEKVVDLQGAVAEALAREEVQSEASAKAIEDLSEALDALDDAVRELEIAVQLLTRGRRDRDQVLEHTGSVERYREQAKKRAEDAKNAPAPATVKEKAQEIRQELFGPAPSVPSDPAPPSPAP